MSAFSAMMGGAECSTSSNPLSQFIKAGHQDHSLHQSGPLAPHQQQQSMRSHTPQQHNDEAQRFFEQPPTAAGGPLGGGGLDQLRSEIDAMARVAMKQPNGAAPGLEQQREWASQYRPAGANLLPADMARMQDQFRLPQGAEGRPSDFAQEFYQQHLAATSSSASASAAGPSMYGQARPGFAPSYGAFGSAGGGMGMGMHSYASPMHSNYATPLPPPQQQQVDVKGKGRFVELDDADWEAQFAQVAAAGETATQSAEPHQATTTSAAQEQEDSTANLLDHGEINLDASE